MDPLNTALTDYKMNIAASSVSIMWLGEVQIWSNGNNAIRINLQVALLQQNHLNIDMNVVSMIFEVQKFSFLTDSEKMFHCSKPKHCLCHTARAGSLIFSQRMVY